MVTHLPATESHLLYRITQFYLPHDISERLYLRQAGRYSSRFTCPEGQKAELTLLVGYIPRRFACPQTVTHPSSNDLIAT